MELTVCCRITVVADAEDDELVFSFLCYQKGYTVKKTN